MNNLLKDIALFKKKTINFRNIRKNIRKGKPSITQNKKFLGGILKITENNPAFKGSRLSLR